MAQNVDWLSTEQASQLDIGFTVLVPSWVPAPFGGSPSIQASGGYYSLYWMNAGGAPTFLQITGEVGGSLPAGSPADLNNQLFINASVQGYDAIHDVTAIYDNVWWIAGGVLYTVSSNNMTGADSLSLANSLIALEAPAYEQPTEEATEEPTEEPTEVATEEPTEVATEAPTPTPTPATDDDGTGGTEGPTPTPESGNVPVGSIGTAGTIGSGETDAVEVFASDAATVRASDGSFADTGQTFIGGVTGGSFAWQAPAVEVTTDVQFTLVDDATGTVTATAWVTVLPVEGGIEPEVTETEAAEVLEDGTGGGMVPEVTETSVPPTPTPTAAAQETETPAAVQTQTAVNGGTNGVLLSDGTAGPQLPPGSDGTGGIWQIALP
jgi:hypothetical protein